MAALKSTFRKFVSHTPLPVHRILTKAKVKNLTRHVMPDSETRKCEKNEQYRINAVKKQMKKFPKQTKRMNRKIEAILSKNPKYSKLSEAEKRPIIEDMQFCWFGYGFEIDEYVFLDLGGVNKDVHKRRQMVSETERWSFRFCANDFTNDVYADKASAYLKLKPLYKRDAVVIETNKDKEKFLEFVKDKTEVVQKNVSSSRGKGVKLVKLDTYPGGKDTYFNDLLKTGKTLLEEVIVQHPDMKSFNPDSVNTVRLSTFYTKSGVIAPYGFFRTGRKGSFIDNCATGGVFATIDTKKGIVCSDSCDELGNRYSVHPDSKKALKGFKLPEWDKAVQLCKQAALLTPDIKYLSWDLAYSEKHGWEIVEVNTSGQLLQQAGTLKGIRTEFKEIIDNMDLLIPFTIRAD